jgi:hypothetical protein
MALNLLIKLVLCKDNLLKIDLIMHSLKSLNLILCEKNNVDLTKFDC